MNIAALLADVDGTLVTKDKVLTPRAIEAVRRLRERGVVFCITSGRPPRGLRMFVEPLDLTIAMAAFNGGILVRPDLSVIDEKPLPKGCRMGDNANAFLGGFRLWKAAGK